MRPCGETRAATRRGDERGTRDRDEREASSSDDDDVPLAQRAVGAADAANGATGGGVGAPGRPTAPSRAPATNFFAKTEGATVARPPIVTPKPPIGGGFKMSKRPVAMPAKQSSRLDSSSDEAPIAAPTGSGFGRTPTTGGGGAGAGERAQVSGRKVEEALGESRASRQVERR